MKRISVLAICILGIFIASCSKNTDAPVPNSPPTNFHGIPPGGTGGDSIHNVLKNRWYDPASSTDMTISEIINLPHDQLSLMGSKLRKNFTQAALTQAGASEAIGVRTTCYLINSRKEGPESCNGYDSNYVDFHLWISDTGHSEKSSIITEATPYWQEQMPKWLIKTFDSLAQKRTQVRISGWILWDEDHPEELDKSRASLWEIHPMTKFEYYDGANWHELALMNNDYMRWNFASLFNLQ